MSGGSRLSRKAVDNLLIRSIEAILFASSKPISARRISIITGRDIAIVRKAIDILKAEYEERKSALIIEELAGGFRFSVKPEFGEVVFEAINQRAAPRLSKAALETLAIIAYKQPVSRIEIQKIRGVNPDSSLSTLIEAGLIEEIESESRKNYKTTRRFLEVLGINSLSELASSKEL